MARQTVEVLGSNRLQCEALAARTGQASAVLAAAIERGLDRADSPAERIRIGRLELRLGPFSPAQWEAALAQAISERLPDEVVEAVRRSEAEHNDTVEAALLLLEGFAGSGRLPWWCGSSDSPQGAIRALRKAGVGGEDIRSILARPGAIARLAIQLGETDLLALIETIMPGLAGHSSTLLDGLAGRSGRRMRPSDGTAGAVPAAVWRAALEEAVQRPEGPGSGAARDDGGSGEDSAPVAAFLEAVEARLGAQKGDFQAGLERSNGGEPAGPPSGSARREKAASAKGSLAQGIAERAEAGGASPAAAAEMGKRIAAIVAGLGGPLQAEAERALGAVPWPAGIEAVIAMLVRERALDQSEAEGWSKLVGPWAGEEEHDCIAVSTSGLAIAWPFLEAFFEDLGLIGDRSFLGLAEQHRAVALLHYLVTGEEACPEQELALAKLLAGLDLDVVHEPGEPIADHEARSADALLDAILANAPMLGKISRSGFREAFLKRPGSLATRDGHWLLRVERRSIDILLDRIPWSFGWIRLPWMPDPVQVEW